MDWIVGIVSAGAVALMFGYLIFHAVRGVQALPELEVARAPAASGTERHLRFVVSNGGARTASEVTVALYLRANPGGSEKRSLTIDFVPANSQVAGAFLLDDAAQAPDCDLRVESYLDP